MSVTIRNKLPKGDTNGLAPLENKLAENPDDVTVCVALVRTDTIEQRPHDDDNPRLVKTVLQHIEPLDGGVGERAEKMLRSAYSDRTGKTELPSDGTITVGGDGGEEE